MRVKTVSELPPLILVAVQLLFTFALWVRVEMLAEMARQAQVNAETAARWANALADDARPRTPTHQ